MSRTRNKNPQPSTKDQLIAELQAELERMRAINQRLVKEMERLRAEVEELRRAGKR